MSERGHEAAGPADRLKVEVFVAVPKPDGGFALEIGGAPLVQALPEGEGWRVDGDGPLAGRYLVRSRRGGFALHAAEGAPTVARTMPLVGVEPEVGFRCLLLEDGRLFRIVLRGPRDARYELLDWEVPGAYLTARPADGTWSLTAEPASTGLEEIDVLTFLLAAEALDADGALGAGRS